MFAGWTAAPLIVFCCSVLLMSTGCPSVARPDDIVGGATNISDATNGAAAYVGANSCRQCHPQIAAGHTLHGHAHALTAVLGAAPAFPEAASRAGVPSPPTGFDWTDVAYVVGGYTKAALFIDLAGSLLTTSQTGVPTQWNLDSPANGTVAGFVPYETAAGVSPSFDYASFRHRTTAPEPPDAALPLFQENRPGFAGTWSEAGVQCEACHGPGSNHFTAAAGQVQIDTSRIFVDVDGAQSCNVCHTRTYDTGSETIQAAGGYILPQQQYSELRASGGHAGFACVTCHDPHRSVAYDRAGAIRNDCTACHTTTTMARHGGQVFVRGDYTEALTCQSCHMPYATREATSASAGAVGAAGRMGDTRTHVFRISATSVDHSGMLTADGSEVLRDAAGRAAVTVDFVCLRCHNGIGNVFELDVDFASEIAQRIHEELASP